MQNSIEVLSSSISAMLELQYITSLLLCFLVPLLFFFFKSILTHFFSPKLDHDNRVPKSYPLIGSYLSIYANRHHIVEWLSDFVKTSPNLTVILRRPLGSHRVITANPAVVQHILKTRFPIYDKGGFFRSTLSDLLGNGIFNADGDNWKFQRQVSSHEFNTRSLRHFIEHVVDTELNERLIPILSTAAANGTVVDFQDILQRFGYDNICKIAFGYDPAYLAQSAPQAKFATAFEEAVQISTMRFRSIVPLVWKIKRFLNIGNEKRLKIAVSEIREFARKIINEKKQELSQNSSIDSVDLLSRFLSSGHSDEDFVTDIVISFILAGKDTTSAALTWFFWLVSKNPEIESEILKEINEKSEAPVYDEVKDMIYTHAALCDSMRLYPPVPMDTKTATDDDVLPDGTIVKKGMGVTYHPYAMGRVEEIWGKDWEEFRPERWLQREGEVGGKWKFVGKDSYTYPVFQAGPRICLGKDMAFLQMKRVVASVLRRFRVVPVDGVEPEFVAYLTSKMKGGFPVKIIKRADAY